METALHGENRHSSDAADNESAGMSLYGGYGEMWDILVVDALLDVDFLYQAPETSPEDDTNFGAVDNSCLEEGSCFLNLVGNHGV